MPEDENVIRATFGRINDLDTTKLLAATGYDESIIEADDSVMISKGELLKLSAIMLVHIRKHLDQSTEVMDSMQAWGFLTAVEFMVSLSERMPDVDLHGMVDKLRTQVHTAMASDTEVIAILERTRDSLHEAGDPLAARDNIDAVLAIMRGD
jgi:hypothetical protein